MIKKELLWLFGTLILIFIVDIIIFGFNGLNYESTIDINFHDTYFVIENFILIYLLSLLILFIVFLFRAIQNKFQNLFSNTILIISIILFILVLNNLYAIINNFNTINNGWTIYPPLSAIENKIDNIVENSSIDIYLNIVSNSIITIQIVLMSLLVFCGYKMGKKYNL